MFKKLHNIGIVDRIFYFYFLNLNHKSMIRSASILIPYLNAKCLNQDLTNLGSTDLGMLYKVCHIKHPLSQ